MQQLTVSDLLMRNGFDPKKVLLIRLDTDGDVCRAAGCLDLYIRIQSQNFEGCNYPFWMVFTRGTGTEARLYGLFRNEGHRRVGPADIPGHYPVDYDAANDELYDLTRLDRFGPVEGRLVIRWPNDTAHWYKPAGTYDMPIVALSATTTVEPFPGFDRLELTFDRLCEVIGSPEAHGQWRAAMSSVYAVYMIVDLHSGEQYVGSAYGADGLWGRWSTYVATGGAGNNEGLRRLIESNPLRSHGLLFSVLRVFDTSTPEKDVLEWEQTYRRRLSFKVHRLTNTNNSNSIRKYNTYQDMKFNKRYPFETWSLRIFTIVLFTCIPIIAVTCTINITYITNSFFGLNGDDGSYILFFAIFIFAYILFGKIASYFLLSEKDIEKYPNSYFIFIDNYILLNWCRIVFFSVMGVYFQIISDQSFLFETLTYVITLYLGYKFAVTVPLRKTLNDSKDSVINQINDFLSLLSDTSIDHDAVCSAALRLNGLLSQDILNRPKGKLPWMSEKNRLDFLQCVSIVIHSPRKSAHCNHDDVNNACPLNRTISCMRNSIGDDNLLDKSLYDETLESIRTRLYTLLNQINSKTPIERNEVSGQSARLE